MMSDPLDNDYFQHNLNFSGQYDIEGGSHMMGFQGSGGHQNPHQTYHSSSMVDYQSYQRLQQMNLHQSQMQHLQDNQQFLRNGYHSS